MRPPEELLAAFRNLSELDETKRRTSIKFLLKSFETCDQTDVKQYYLERLVGGLSSGRAATRLGYTSVLSLLLGKSDAGAWNTLEVLAVAEKRLDLTDKIASSGNAIGQYLLISAIVNNGAFPEKESAVLIEQIGKVHDAAPSLSFPLAKLVADMSLKVGSKTFTEFILPYAESKWKRFASKQGAEGLLLTLLLRKKFPKIISQHNTFVKATGEVVFNKSFLEKALQSLRECDLPSAQILIVLLLNSARESDILQQMYTEVVEPWALGADETKVLERIFLVVRSYLNGDGQVEDVSVFFTSNFMNRLELVMRGKGHNRLLKPSVSAFGDYIKSKLESVKGVAAYDLLKKLNAVGDVDKFTGASICAQLLSKLDSKSIQNWVKDWSKKAGDESLGKLAAAFQNWDEKSRFFVLKTLCQMSPTPSTQSVTANLVDSLFYVKTRPGEFASIQLSEQNENQLKTLLASLTSDAEVDEAHKATSKSVNRTKPLFVLWLVVRLWSRIAATDEDRKSYEVDASEILKIAENDDAKNTTNAKVLVDLLISLLSREQKYHRTPVAFAFSHSLPTLSSTDVVHIIETASMDDDELMDNENSGDEDGDDEEDVNDENAPLGQDEDAEDVEEDEDSDESDEEEENEELVEKLNEALGDAADHSGASEEEMDDLDDDAMMQMDERLAAAFRAIAPASVTKKSKERASGVEALKMKLADLLLIAISSRDAADELKLNLIVPLVQWTKKELKKNDRLAFRAVELLRVVNRLKVSVKEKLLVKVFNGVVHEAEGVTNPVLTENLSATIAFLVNCAVDDEGNLLDGMKIVYFELFKKFAFQTEGAIASEFVVVPVLKHPRLFAGSVDTFVETGFDENVRIFRRTEILSCATNICDRSVAKVATFGKSFSKKATKLASAYLSAVVADPSDVKPRFFANVLRLLLNVSAVVRDDDGQKAKMAEKLDEILTKVAECQPLRNHKINAKCQQICGKKVETIIAGIRKNLNN